MAEILSLYNAVKCFVNDGGAIALDGFTHWTLTVESHEITRQNKKDMTFMHMTQDLVYDLLIGAGCAKRWSSPGRNPSVSSLQRLHDAVEKGWPYKLGINHPRHGDQLFAGVEALDKFESRLTLT